MKYRATTQHNMNKNDNKLGSIDQTILDEWLLKELTLIQNVFHIRLYNN